MHKRTRALVNGFSAHRPQNRDTRARACVYVCVYTQKCTRLTPNGAPSRSLITRTRINAHALGCRTSFLARPTNWRKDLTRIKPNEILMRKVPAIRDNIPQYSRFNDFSSREIYSSDYVWFISLADDKRRIHCFVLIVFLFLIIYLDNCFAIFMFSIGNSNFHIFESLWALSKRNRNLFIVKIKYKIIYTYN